jgi:hypothetical protein
LRIPLVDYKANIVMKRATTIILFIFLTSLCKLEAQVQVDKFTGDASYGLPLITVPNFRGPSVSTSLMYSSDIKVDQPASEVGLGWSISAGGSIERSVRGIPDDWKDINTADVASASFAKHLGALHFDKTHTSTVLDFDYTRFKMDTLNDSIRFYYPNYDSYYVVGGGMSGEISPENYDYATVKPDTSLVKRWFYYDWYDGEDLKNDSISLGVRITDTYTIDGTNGFNYKTKFRYNYNNYAETDSRYFPWDESPLTSSSNILIPGETVNDSIKPFEGIGFNDENHIPSSTQNRTRTSNYIEYYTNSELDAGVTGFLEYDTTFNRGTAADFPTDGIGAYQITDPNGYTYHYSLPVYTHYNTNGNFSLDKDHNVIVAEGGVVEKNENNGSYLLENDYTYEILETKQNEKYAIRWLLTAITGPDFEDTNDNGVVDMADGGYWVTYDYGLWTESFPDRFPYYGSNYAFTGNYQEGLSAFMDNNDENSNANKMLMYSETANQKYYLNKIQTPSHTAIFARDLRYDEQSMIVSESEYEYTSTTNLRLVSDTLNYLNGSGIFTTVDPYTGSVPKYYRLTINPMGVDSIKLFIDQWYSGGYNDDYVDTLTVFDGKDSTGTILYRDSVGGNDLVIVSGSDAITIEYMKTNTNGSAGRYEIRWESKWANATGGWPGGRPETLPQLKLSQLFLFDNDDLSSLPTLSAIDTITNDNLWDYDNLNRSSCYSTDWYLANQSLIDSLALQSVSLEQDYTLAKGYVNSRYVYVDINENTADQVEVETNKYIDTNNTSSSGKLTLNKVIYYGLNKTQTQPSHLFDYSVSDTTDNPNYNSLNQDYWGNFKSDAEGNLLRGYVTDDSKGRTDAWSLRKITSPLGGITEIIYESDEYEQVLNESEEGGLRGSIKTFVIKSAIAVGGDIGYSWTFDVENQETEFRNLADSLPISANREIAIPGIFIDPLDSATGDNRFYLFEAFADEDYGMSISYGEGNLVVNPDTISSLRYYNINLLDTIPGTIPLIDGNDSLVYAGEGYVSFNYSVGEKVNGGGTRVKELKVSNDAETYVVAYSYDEGTATAEASDFAKRGKMKKDDSDWWYKWGITAFEMSPFDMSPQVGYGKVTIENKGQGSSGQGKSIYSFNISNEGKNYNTINHAMFDTVWTRVGTMCGNQGADGTTTNRRYAVEIIDDFTSIWGKIKQQTLEDINGNIVSKKVYDYSVSSNGAHVNTVNFNIRSEGACYISETHITSINRKYPTYLNKVTTYSNGRKSESEIIARDPFTGNPIETKNTSINGTISKEKIVLAYLQTTPDYEEMGAKSDDPTNNNFLSATYSSKSYKSSEGLTTSDFSSYGKSFWKDSTRVRYYDATNNEYTLKTDTVNWFDYIQYAWAGSLGNYGLFDTTGFSEITAPPSGASDWRFLSEITLMDEEQNVLEQKGYNDRFTASKLGYDNRFTYTSASNANYVSFTASGFETETEVESGVIYYEGEVLSLNEDRFTVDGNVYPHTGNYMVKIPSANFSGPKYSVKYDTSETIYSLQRGRTYMASIWVHKDSPSSTKLNIDIEGDTASTTYSEADTMSIENSEAIQIGDWIQLTVNIEVPSNFTSETNGDGIDVYVDKGSGDAWIDDLQFKSRVSGSGMNVYDQKTGRVMATLSDNNFATKYVYNDAGQVIEVWKEVLGDTWGKWVKVESRDFNFQRDME